MAAATVQSTKGSGSYLKSLTSTAFASAVSAGNAILVAVCTSSGTAGSNDVSSVTDSAGNSYQRLDSVFNASGYISIEVWICLNVSTGGSNLKVTAADSNFNLVALIAYEISGLLGGTGYSDGTHGVSSFQSSGGTTVSNALTTVVANDLLLNFAAVANTGAWTGDASWGNTVTTNAVNAFVGQTRVAGSAGSYGATETNATASLDYAGIMVALKAAGAAPPAANSGAFFAFF